MKIRIAFAFFICCLSAAQLHAQAALTVPRNQCETANGSRRASDALQTLNKLPATMNGRDDAIASCDTKVQTLKKQEEDKWGRANQARSQGQCAVAKQAFEELSKAPTAYQKEAGDQLHSLNCAQGAAAADTSSSSNVCTDAAAKLANAQGALNSSNFPQAKSLANAALSCNSTADQARKLLDQIGEKENNGKLAENARASLAKNDKEGACKFIVQISAAYPGLKELKSRSGECATAAPAAPAAAPPVVVADAGRGTPDNTGRGQRAAAPAAQPAAPPPPPPDPLLADYNKAVGLVKTNPAAAEKMLQQISSQDKGYKDVAELLKSVRDDLQNKDFAALEQQAHNYSDKGDLQAALGKIDRAIALRANEVRLKDFKQQLLNRIDQERISLSSGIDAYYSGKYDQATKLLTAFANDAHSPRVLALAHFYVGASAASEFYLGQQKDSAKKEEARSSFSRAIKDAPQFSPDLTKLSPKIRNLFAEATAKSGQK
jgi:tetratricopeptide (TPR) repeat protein